MSDTVPATLRFSINSCTGGVCTHSMGLTECLEAARDAILSGLRDGKSLSVSIELEMHTPRKQVS